MGGRELGTMTGAAAKVLAPARGPMHPSKAKPFAIGKAFGLAAATHELDARRATILSYMPQQE